MASTARSKDEEREFFDSEEVLTEKVKLLASMVVASKHMVSFTGAGISTSAGIPDFRSGVDTVLDTGAGKWAKDAAIQAGHTVKAAKRRVASTLKAIPTVTHMALVRLAEDGILKMVISQNCDGLHRRSGLPVDKLSELHGNSNLERCQTCAKQYLRDFRTRSARGVKKHETGRFCAVPGCGGPLLDTIINFGEYLPESELETAGEHSKMGDLCLAMGSSLTVTPAADFPKEMGKRRTSNLVIVNLQKTPLDKYATIRINAKTDTVMQRLMEELRLPIPEWRLRRYARLSLSKPPRAPKSAKWMDLRVAAIDSDATPTSLFRAMEVVVNDLRKAHKIKGRKFTDLLPPKTFRIKAPAIGSVESAEEDEHAEVAAATDGSGDDFYVKFGFVGHYREPEIKIDLHEFIDLRNCGLPSFVTLQMTYNPFDGQWQDVAVFESKGDILPSDALAEATSAMAKLAVASAASG